MQDDIFMRISNILFCFVLFFVFPLHAHSEVKIYCESEAAIINNDGKRFHIQKQDFYLTKPSLKEYKLHFINSMKVFNPIACSSNEVFINCELSNKYGYSRIEINRVNGKYNHISNTKDSKTNATMMDLQTFGACYGSEKTLF